ncbi:type I restriction endonuclease [Snodgrassella alvi]|uniref:type I restriction endonuclease n=1 Tax=Snodgrassella alvi TaxID=1196083 RepID=UPI00352C52BF
MAKAGVKAKKWRIDLILFINGLPFATLELKSKFKQAVQKMLKMAKSIQVMMLVRQNQNTKNQNGVVYNISFVHAPKKPCLKRGN